MPLKQNQQKILLKMISNGHRTDYFSQDIYPSFRIFKQEMQMLKNADLVNMATIKRDGKFIIEYTLTPIDGVIFSKLLRLVDEKLII